MASTRNRDHDVRRIPAGAPRLLSTCRRLTVAGAFWLAILLPVVYGPLLLADGLGGPDRWLTLALVVAHAVTVVVGQGHTGR